MSVAIIPMSHQFGWNSSVAGLLRLQSSFFWDYALSQLPGGWLAKLFGGRLVFEDFGYLVQICNLSYLSQLAIQNIKLSFQIPKGKRENW